MTESKHPKTQKALDDFINGLNEEYGDGSQFTEKQQMMIMVHLANLAAYLDLEVPEERETERA